MEPCSKCENPRPLFIREDGTCNKCIWKPKKIKIDPPKPRSYSSRRHYVKVVWGNNSQVKYFDSASNAALYCGVSDATIFRMLKNTRNMRGFGFFAYEMTPEEVANANTGKIKLQEPK